MKSIKIAQFQTLVPQEKEQTLALVEQVCRETAAQGVDIVTLPEMFCCPYEPKNFPIYAEEDGGYVWTTCAQIAQKHNIYLSAGSVPEKDKSGNIFNTAYVFNREGKQIAKHRKIHMFDINVKNGQSFKESDYLAAGNTVTTFETEFCTFGLCICYDFRFPELGRLMALQGAQVILVPAAFNMTTGPAHWDLTFRSQALSNQAYVVGTSQARNSSAFYVSWGHSLVVDPWGKIIQQTDEKTSVQITDLDLSRVSEIRSQLPLLQHRRTDVYSLTLK